MAAETSGRWWIVGSAFTGALAGGESAPGEDLLNLRICFTSGFVYTLDFLNQLLPQGREGRWRWRPGRAASCWSSPGLSSPLLFSSPHFSSHPLLTPSPLSSCWSSLGLFIIPLLFIFIPSSRPSSYSPPPLPSFLSPVLLDSSPHLLTSSPPPRQEDEDEHGHQEEHILPPHDGGGRLIYFEFNLDLFLQLINGFVSNKIFFYISTL